MNIAEQTKSIPKTPKISKGKAKPKQKNKVVKLKEENSKSSILRKSDDDVISAPVLHALSEKAGDVDALKTQDYTIAGWKKPDIATLLSRIEEELPKNDDLRFELRVENINWEKIKFASYSASECKDKWKLLQRKLRRYRLLNELVHDAKIWLEKPWEFKSRVSTKLNTGDLSCVPMSGFVLYFLGKRDLLLKKYPDKPLPVLARKLQKKYKKLPIEKKTKYKSMASALRLVTVKS